MLLRHSHAPVIPLSLVVIFGHNDSMRAATLELGQRTNLLRQVARLSVEFTGYSGYGTPAAELESICALALTVLSKADRMRTLSLTNLSNHDIFGTLAAAVRSRRLPLWPDLKQLSIEHHESSASVQLKDVWDMLSAAPAVVHLGLTSISRMEHSVISPALASSQFVPFVPPNALESIMGCWDASVLAAISSPKLKRIALHHSFEKTSHPISDAYWIGSHPVFQQVTSFTVPDTSLPLDWNNDIIGRFSRLRDILLPMRFRRVPTWGDEDDLLQALQSIPQGASLKSLTIFLDDNAIDLRMDAGKVVRVVSRLDQAGDGRLRRLRRLCFLPIRWRVMGGTVKLEDYAAVVRTLKPWARSRRVSLKVG